MASVRGANWRTEQDLRDLLSIPANYRVIFMQRRCRGPVRAAVPMELLRGETADYLVSGGWSKSAVGEAAKFGSVNVMASSEKNGYQGFPLREMSGSRHILFSARKAGQLQGNAAAKLYLRVQQRDGIRQRDPPCRATSPAPLVVMRRRISCHGRWMSRLRPGSMRGAEETSVRPASPSSSFAMICWIARRRTSLGLPSPTSTWRTTVVVQHAARFQSA